MLRIYKKIIIYFLLMQWVDDLPERKVDGVAADKGGHDAPQLPGHHLGLARQQEQIVTSMIYLFWEILKILLII